MNYRRIHITGASGSGTTTLGRRISEEFGLSHFDTDDFFWEPSDPPYQVIREKRERQRLLKFVLNTTDKWVLSGSLCGWGDFVIPLFELVIYLWIPENIRMARLKKRELMEFGKAAISPGGKMHESHAQFMAWASAYDRGGLDIQSRALHESWLNNLKCKVCRYEDIVSTEDIVKQLYKGID